MGSVLIRDAVVLAGGQGKRVGGRQKALMEFQGRPILSYILQQLEAEVETIWVNANADFQRYQAFGCVVFADQIPEFLGPLEGMRSAWHQIKSDWILFVPGDNPMLPQDLLKKLWAAKQSDKFLYVAHDGERVQPLYSLMHRSLLPSLQTAVEKGHLSVKRWIEEQPHRQVDFSEQPERFKNMNHLADFKTSLPH